MMNGEKVLIVTTMKNEGPYILEWVAHHLALGVDNILVFTNDCDDLTDRILDRLEQLAPLRHEVNPKAMFPEKGNWQVMAQRFAAKFNLYRDSDWIYHTDVDEFVQINVGEGRLDDFYAEARERTGAFDVISFTSIPFSSSGKKHLKDTPVTAQFTTTHQHYDAARARGDSILTAVKTMFRNDVAFDMRRNHRPLMSGFSSAGHVWINGSGTPMPADFTDGTIKAIDALGSTELAQMNHYAIRSAEAFLVKLDRGDVAGVPRLDKSSHYWERYNAPGDEDLRYQQMRPEARALFDQFLADPVLRELHDNSFAIHQQKVERIRQTPAWHDMLVRLGLVEPDGLEGDGQERWADLGLAADWAEARKDEPLKTIASFWIGDPLSYVEHLVIRSFLDAGHPFVLYTLDDIGPVPDGVELRDAREIYAPAFDLGPGLRHNNAVYSDIFRLLMIAKTGAIWADLDAYCLRPFILPTEYYFGYEQNGESIANGVLGMPTDSLALARATELVLSHNPIPPFFTKRRQGQYLERAKAGESFGFENFTWGASGPRLITHFLRETGEERFAMPKDVFYPGPRPFNQPLLRPEMEDAVFETDRTLSVHFWGKTKTVLREEYDGVPPEGSYLARLLKRHDVDPAEFPLILSENQERQATRSPTAN